MIAVKKNLNISEIPNSLKNEECINSFLEINDLNNSKHKEKIKPKIYCASDVYIMLKYLYNNKCAYCESYESEPQIEHYRPKKQVTGIQRIVHEGYYWLSYEWSNLLPACHDCNKSGAKGNEFPIEGNRVFHPLYKLNKEIDLEKNLLNSDYLNNEKPLLLNPENQGFDPFIYFKFDITGIIKEKPDKKTFEFRQAKETIRIVKLNRDNLYLNYRKIKIEELFQEKIKPIFVYYRIENNLTKNGFKDLYFKILSYIKKNNDPNCEYSFFWSYIYYNFADYILHYCSGEYNIELLNFYNEFKELNK
jgi:uncharacterized protein (TIGR02646 family)